MRYLGAGLILLFLFAFVQTQSPEVYLGCYKNGDTLSIETLQGIKHLSLLSEGKGQKDSWLKSWEMLVYHSGKFQTFSGFADSPTIAGPMADALKTRNGTFPDKVVIQGITIMTKTADKITEKKLPSSTFYVVKKSK